MVRAWKWPLTTINTEYKTELRYTSSPPYIPSRYVRGQFLPLLYQHGVVYKKTVILVPDFIFECITSVFLASVSSRSQRIFELLFYILQFWLKPGNKTGTLHEYLFTRTVGALYKSQYVYWSRKYFSKIHTQPKVTADKPDALILNLTFIENQKWAKWHEF